MRTHFIEATQSAETGFNWGKFMVAQFDDEEWERPSAMIVKTRNMGPTLPVAWSSLGLLGQRGWTSRHVLIYDLETGEGAIFLPGGSPSADLAKHRVWVCPMFEPFLAWLYEFIATTPDRPPESDMGVLYDETITWFDQLPSLVELPDAPAAMSGYRREGPVAGG